MPVQASAVPCERIFSSSKETFTPSQTKLSDDHIKALQILKFIYCSERESLNFFTGRLAIEDELMQAKLDSYVMQQHLDNRPAMYADIDY